MRKVMFTVLFGLGVFLLVAAAVLRFWGGPRAEKVPLDTDTTTRLSGTAVKLGETMDVKAKSVTAVDSKKSDDKVVVFVNTVCLVKTSSPTDCGTQGTGDNADPNVVSITAEAFAADRHTGVAVNDSKYLPANGAHKSGLVNKWPFNTEKKTYLFWDDVVGKALPATYVGTQKRDGLTTYEFHQVISDQPAEIADGTQGTYSQDKTMWVEPKTGSIVDQQQHEVRKLTDGTTVLDLNLRFTPTQVKDSIDEAKSGRQQLLIVEVVGPVVGLVLGLVSLVVGLIGMRRRTASEEVSREYADARS